MGIYLLRRLLLLPLTLFAILLVNFVIINLAPGDPVTLKTLGADGSPVRSEKDEVSYKNEDPYLIFRQRYGLSLPILFNTWPFYSSEKVKDKLQKILSLKVLPKALSDYMDAKQEGEDGAQFIMQKLLEIAQSPSYSFEMRSIALKLFFRGGIKLARLGASLTPEEEQYNIKVAKDNQALKKQMSLITEDNFEDGLNFAELFYAQNKEENYYEPSFLQKVQFLFFETRLAHYMKRVISLDFGTLRNNQQKKVIDEVISRMKYSLTLSVIPLIITFILCQALGLIMAIYQNRWIDRSLNFFFLLLYAIPVFVVAPFLIENVALNHSIPFLSIDFPLGGFTYSDTIYQKETTFEKLIDILLHITLPLIALIYGSLAIQSRIARTAMLEVMRLDFVKTARAKGVDPLNLWIKHVGINGSITIVTSVAASLGAILSGSLIVETLFQIDGFGKFFYEAILNRDYNVMMFSAISSAFLSLVGYLVADIAYTLLDPRVSLE